MENKENTSGYCILVADDDMDDQYLIKEALLALNFKNVETVNNGEELLDYLHKREKFKNSNALYPKVILLDLNMPRKNGRECLKEMRANPKFNKIPVVMYSTSNNPEDISQCYELGANGYIMKPHSYNELVDIMETFKKYWFTMMKTPQITL